MNNTLYKYLQPQGDQYDSPFWDASADVIGNEGLAVNPVALSAQLASETSPAITVNGGTLPTAYAQAKESTPIDWNGVGMTAMGMIGGVAGMLPAAKNLLSTKDTTQYEGVIDSIDDISRVNYNNFDQAQRDWQYVSSAVPKISGSDIAHSSKENWANIGSMALSGLNAGMSLGSPYAAIGGTLLGGAAGLLLGGIGKRNADYKASELNMQREAAIQDAQVRVRANTDNLIETKRRQGIANFGAEGGKMERKQQSIQEFADRVLKAQKNSDRTHSAGIVRQHCKGGTMVRIKMK